MNRPEAKPDINDPAFVRDSRRSRPRYFEGQFLTARDLNSEQEYLLARQADFARALGFGVVEGLHVTRLARKDAAAPGSETKLSIEAGVGTTPAGDVVQLPRDMIVDVAEIDLMRELNARFGLSQQPQQPFASLDGLFVFGLRQVEFTANPTPVFPASLDGRDRLRDGEIVEATAFTLVPYVSTEADAGRPEQTLARVAREIFLDGKPPVSPGGVLPLAMLLLRGGVIVWADEALVRREAGDDDRFGFGFAPRALAEAHFHHYRARIAGAEMPLDTARAAAVDHFEVLPPGGPLPAGVVDMAAFTQTFFPPEARVDIVIVPSDELPALMDESLDLPPVDLRLKPEDNDALAFLILAPVPRAEFDDTLATVAPEPLPAGIGSRTSVTMPRSLMVALNAPIPVIQDGESIVRSAGRKPAPAAEFVISAKAAKEVNAARVKIEKAVAAAKKESPKITDELVFAVGAEMDKRLAEVITLPDGERTNAVKMIVEEMAKDRIAAIPDDFPDLIRTPEQAVADLEKRAEARIKEGGPDLAKNIEALLDNCAKLRGSLKTNILVTPTALVALNKRIGVVEEKLRKAKPVAQPPVVTPTPTPTPPADEEPASDPIVDARWTATLAKVTEFWYVRRRNLPPPGKLAGTAHAVNGIAAPRPPLELAGESTPKSGDGSVDGTGSEPDSETSTEGTRSDIAGIIAEEKLAGGFLSLKLAADPTEHAALVASLSALAKGPRILMHEAVERLLAVLKFDSNAPSKNFTFVLNGKQTRKLTIADIRMVHDAVTVPAFIAGLEKALGAEALAKSALFEPLARSGKLDAISTIGNSSEAVVDAFMKQRAKILDHAQRRRPVDIATAVTKFVEAARKRRPR